MNDPLAAGQPSLRTTVQQSNHPGPDYFLLPLYDQILVPPQTSYALPRNPMTRGAADLGIVEIDQSDYWPGCSWKEVIQAMCDHRTVWSRADYDAVDLD
jgi:hypothetical protein